MDATLKTKWVEALRSGDFEQAQFKLKRGSAYCCLGVLCKVANISISENGDVCEGRGYGPIVDLIGDQYETLYSLNDSKGKSFSEIADYIEANL